MARTQDFTQFTPELLGAAQGPKTPCRKAASSRRERVASAPLSDLRTHHFGLATPLNFKMNHWLCVNNTSIYGLHLDRIYYSLFTFVVRKQCNLLTHEYKNIYIIILWNMHKCQMWPFIWWPWPYYMKPMTMNPIIFFFKESDILILHVLVFTLP